MITDRELLEGAARAAGIRLSAESGPNNNFWIADEFGQALRFWNPLTSHGDRYRLASKLKMLLDFEYGRTAVPLFSEAGFFLHNHCEEFTPGNDKEEALAIVRAAAATVGVK